LFCQRGLYIYEWIHEKLSSSRGCFKYL
jgi:hypothetical protein